MAVEVKICGITTPEDAAMAVAAGASWLGVVFAPGPRRIDARRAALVAAAAGTVPVLGVFGGQTEPEILAACWDARLAGAQLHGPYPVRVAARLRRQGLLVWRVIRPESEADLASIGDYRAEASAVVVEPGVKGVWGGAGVALPLESARLARALLPGFRMVLAGGLTPETVARAIATAGPDVVDVSSGVEVRPGIKDPSRLQRFMEAAVGHHTSA